MKHRRKNIDSCPSVFVNQDRSRIFEPVGDQPTEVLLPSAAGVHSVHHNHPADVAAGFADDPIARFRDRILVFLFECEVAEGALACLEHSAVEHPMTYGVWAKKEIQTLDATFSDR